ncbi:MAG: S-layer family protein [Burkholderiaceae bacterium]|nr:MAG: S-layer family protein [Burkholderiaceae bacterium]
MSLGDMRVGGALDANREATGQARAINNAGSASHPDGGINAGGNLTLTALTINNTNPDLLIARNVPISKTNEPDMYGYPGTDPLPQSGFVWGDQAKGGSHLILAAHPDRYFTVYPPAYVPEHSACTGTGETMECAAVPTALEPRNSSRFAEFGVAPPPQTAVALPDPRAYGAQGPYDAGGNDWSAGQIYYTWPSGADRPGYDAAMTAYDADQAAHTHAAIALNDAVNAANAENLRELDNSVSHGNNFVAYTGVTQQVSEDQLLRTGPGRITAGGDIAIAGQLNNIDSIVIAGGTIAVQGPGPNNQSTQGTRTTTTAGTAQEYHVKYHSGGVFGDESWSHDPQGGATGYASTTYQTIALAPSVYLQHANSGATGNVRANGNTGQNVAASGSGASGFGQGFDAGSGASGASASQAGPFAGGVGGIVPVVAEYPGHAASGAALTVRTLESGPHLPASSLYVLNADNPNAPLVETDPAFTQRGQWLSLDYMLNGLGLDPATLQRRLGDGFYEQQLIQQQVGQLTAQRFIGDYTSNDAEYRALMDAGITYAEAHQLRPGIALTAEQIAALTSDIVWLVNETVTLPDGSAQTVLAPKLYVLAQPGERVACDLTRGVVERL